MVKIPREHLYNFFLRWSVQRDQLNAHFTRFGSGFITVNNLKEANELIHEVNQNLMMIQNLKIRELDNCSRLVELERLPKSKDD